MPSGRTGITRILIHKAGVVANAAILARAVRAIHVETRHAAGTLGGTVTQSFGTGKTLAVKTCNRIVTSSQARTAVFCAVVLLIVSVWLFNNIRGAWRTIGAGETSRDVVVLASLTDGASRSIIPEVFTFHAALAWCGECVKRSSMTTDGTFCGKNVVVRLMRLTGAQCAW